jgi:hypothetical protein
MICNCWPLISSPSPPLNLGAFGGNLPQNIISWDFMEALNPSRRTLLVIPEYRSKSLSNHRVACVEAGSSQN